MKRFFVVLLLLLVPYILCGCAVTGKIGGWSIWSATATSVVIVNNTADSYLAVLVNGKPQTDRLVEPGEHFSLPLRNFSSKRKEFTVTVMAYDERGRMRGVARDSFSLGRYEADAETWVINTQDLQARK